MCVNDIISQGAKPLFFLDYYSTSNLDKDKSFKVIKGIAKGCEISNTSLIGGETAEMPNIYQKNDFDIAGFCVGIIEKENLLPKKISLKMMLLLELNQADFIQMDIL